jgi:cell division protease FtsH
MKNFLKGPWLYIIAGLLIVWAGFSFLTTVNYSPVSTKEGLAFIDAKQVKEITVIDRDQRVDMILKTADKTYGDHVQFYYASPRASLHADRHRAS